VQWVKAEENNKNRIVSWEKVLEAFRKRKYTVLTKQENYHNGSTRIEYLCNIHKELGSQFITYHQLETVFIRETGYVYIRGCKWCNKERFREDLHKNYEKYYRNRELYQIGIEECKRRFEEKGDIIFVEGQQYRGDKHQYLFICKKHKEKGVQKKKLNYLLRSSVRFACTTCGIESRSKENSPLWRGGVTTENSQIRHSVEYIKWRESVFKRDGYMCQAFGDNNGGNLEAHHIENFSEIPEKRFSVENGITLCKKHHDPTIKGSFHDIYSTQNNTKEQLDEYLMLIHQEYELSWEKINSIKNKVRKERQMNGYRRPASTKLTDSMVIEIMDRLKSTKDSYEVIARDYHVAHGRIHAIAKGLAFRDITKGRILR
jgi:hypothetical protein